MQQEVSFVGSNKQSIVPCIVAEVMLLTKPLKKHKYHVW